MIIDDSEVDLFIQERLLHLFGFCKELITYKSAQDALDAIGAAGIAPSADVIFLDLNMPEPDGYSFLESFESFPESVIRQSKIIVLTSSNSRTDRDKAFQYKHVVHFVTKPLNESHIVEIKEIIDKPSVA